MKKLILFLSCASILFNGRAQQLSRFIIENPAASPWQYYAEKISSTNDGGLLIIKATPNTLTGGNNFSLIKTDSLFQVVWTKDLNGFPSQAQISEIGNLPSSNGYYIVADLNVVGFTNLIIETDLSGNITSSKNYSLGTGVPYAKSSLKFFPNGDKLLFGSDFNSMRFAVIDTTGNLINSFSFAGDSSSIKSPGMNSRVLGDSLILFTSKYDSSAVTGVLSRTGNVIWTKRFYYPGLYEQPKALLLLSDSNILVGGSFVNANNSSNGSFIMKLDQNGNLLWKKTYSSALFTGFTINELIEKPNGNIITKDLFDGILMEVNGNGDVIKTKIIDGNNIRTALFSKGVYVICNKFNSTISSYNPSIHKSELDLNNACLFVDYSGMNSNQISTLPNIQTNYFISPVNSTMNSLNITSFNSNLSYILNDVCSNVGFMGSNSIINKIQVFPNPTKEYVNITFENFESSEINYSIDDIQGEKISEGVIILNGGNTSLNLKNITPGFYSISLYSGKNIIGKSKLIITD